jgi:hypothetical protein
MIAQSLKLVQLAPKIGLEMASVCMKLSKTNRNRFCLRKNKVTVIALVILAIDFLTSLLLGEFSAARYASIRAELSVSAIIVVGLTALKSYLDRVYVTCVMTSWTA